MVLYQVLVLDLVLAPEYQDHRIIATHHTNMHRNLINHPRQIQQMDMEIIQNPLGKDHHIGKVQLHPKLPTIMVRDLVIVQKQFQLIKVKAKVDLRV